MKVAQSCLTLCDPVDYTGHGILPVRILEWVASHSLFRGIFPTQGLNLGFPHCILIHPLHNLKFDFFFFATLLIF